VTRAQTARAALRPKNSASDSKRDKRRVKTSKWNAFGGVKPNQTSQEKDLPPPPPKLLASALLVPKEDEATQGEIGGRVVKACVGISTLKVIDFGHEGKRIERLIRQTMADALNWTGGSVLHNELILRDVHLEGVEESDRATLALVNPRGVLLMLRIDVEPECSPKYYADALTMACNEKGKRGMGGYLKNALVEHGFQMNHHLGVKLHEVKIERVDSSGGTTARLFSKMGKVSSFVRALSGQSLKSMGSQNALGISYVDTDEEQEENEDGGYADIASPEKEHESYLEEHPDRSTLEAIKAMRRISEPDKKSQQENELQPVKPDDFVSLATGQVLKIKSTVNNTMFISERYTLVEDVEQDKIQYLHKWTGMSKPAIRKIHANFMYDTHSKGQMDSKTFFRCMSARYGVNDGNFISELFRIFACQPSNVLTVQKPTQTEDLDEMDGLNSPGDLKSDKSLVNFDSFVRCLSCFKTGEVSLGGRKTQAKALFDLVDHDGDGEADLMDFYRFISTYTPKLSTTEASDDDKTKRRDMLLKNVDRVYWAFDRSGDGVIDTAEFLAGLCLSDEMWELFGEVNPFKQHRLKPIFQTASGGSISKGTNGT